MVGLVHDPLVSFQKQIVQRVAVAGGGGAVRLTNRSQTTLFNTTKASMSVNPDSFEANRDSEDLVG